MLDVNDIVSARLKNYITIETQCLGCSQLHYGISVYHEICPLEGQFIDKKMKRNEMKCVEGKSVSFIYWIFIANVFCIVFTYDPFEICVSVCLSVYV